MSQTPPPQVIQYEDFAKLDLRIGRIVEAVEHPNADKLILLKVDLGSEQRQLCAGLRDYYQADQLIGRSIVVLANLTRKMRGEVSQGMLLAASTADRSRVVLLAPEQELPPGSVVS